MLKSGHMVYHETLMSDLRRVDGLACALRRRVQPGMVVLDAGTGSGWMAVLAARLGARRVYAVEREGIARVAEELIRLNGVGDRVILIRDNLAQVRLRERADLMVSETVGNAAWNEGLSDLLRSARRRLLRPHARIIPSRLALRLAPVASLGRAAVRPSRRILPEIDLAPVFAGNLNRMIHLRETPGRLRGEPRRLFRLDLELGAIPGFPWTQEARWTIARSGPVAGFAGWADGAWTDGLPFSTRRPSSWSPILFPIRPGLKARPGGSLALSVTFITATRLHWAVSVDGRPWSRHDTALGDPAAVTHARLQREEVIPVPSPITIRKAAVLSAVDGKRPLVQIARALRGREPFRGMPPSEVREYVRDTIVGEEMEIGKKA